jgi:hypothetical protein
VSAKSSKSCSQVVNDGRSLSPRPVCYYLDTMSYPKIFRVDNKEYHLTKEMCNGIQFEYIFYSSSSYKIFRIFYNCCFIYYPLTLDCSLISNQRASLDDSFERDDFLMTECGVWVWVRVTMTTMHQYMFSSMIWMLVGVRSRCNNDVVFICHWQCGSMADGR